MLAKDVPPSCIVRVASGGSDIGAGACHFLAGQTQSGESAKINKWPDCESEKRRNESRTLSSESVRVFSLRVNR